MNRLKVFFLAPAKRNFAKHCHNDLPAGQPPRYRRHQVSIALSAGIQTMAEHTQVLSSGPEDVVRLQGDNPCWGSPTQCDLKHLLSQFPLKDLIVYESDQYVVLNKPPDLRMDGPYLATVHKLLTYLYPPPSLQMLDKSSLLEAVTKLHQHNSLPDNALRHCHQLDYATSGLLCVARTQEAANYAARQWEERKVIKEYLALVEGSLPPLSSLPRLTPSRIQATLQELEERYKKSRKPKSNKKQQTFQGFLPTHALFQKFKAVVTTESDPSSIKASKKRPRPSEVLTPDQWNQIWEPVHRVLQTTEQCNGDGDQSQAISACDLAPPPSIRFIRDQVKALNWKQVCRTKPQWKEAFQQATDIHNNLFRQALQEQREEEAKDGDEATTATFPTIFGEIAEDDGNGESGEPVPGVYYIYCPLGQGRLEDTSITADYNFSMKVPPPESPQWLEQYPHIQPFVGPPDLDYKPALTKCIIFPNETTASYSSAEETSVTKVRLLPLTGRRHQLRVHMALLMGGGRDGGFGILGDATYSQRAVNSTTGISLRIPRHKGRSLLDGTLVPAATTVCNNKDNITQQTRRMCLHSHKLALRLLVSVKEERQAELQKNGLVCLETLDPFYGIR